MRTQANSSACPSETGGPFRFPAGLPNRVWVSFSARGYSTPVCGVIYRSADTLWSGMPLGGIATGCLDIDNDGTLGYCTLFTRVWGHDAGDDGGRMWRDIVWAAKDGRLHEACLDDPSRGKMEAPFLGVSAGGQMRVLTTRRMDGVGTASEIDYWGHYPIADLEYTTDSPVQAGLRCWSPFLPGDAHDSDIPAAIFEVTLRNTSQSAQSGQVVMSFPGPRPRELGGSVVTRKPVAGAAYRGVHVSSATRMGYVLAALGSEGVDTGAGLDGDGGAWSAAAKSLPEPGPSDAGASVSVGYSLAAGASRTVRFVLAWYSPTWDSDFPYDGNPDRSFTNAYAARYADAAAVADLAAARHPELLQRIIAWQSVIYAEKSLPDWLKDGLVNTLHLFTECGFWGAPGGELGDWCAPEGVYSLVESSVADGQQSCIPCDWYGNLPLVFFYPNLARTTLRAYAHFTREDGAVPFTLGRGFDLAGEKQWDRQRTLNGCCFVDLVDRLWQRTGDRSVLQEFYPAVKRSVSYMMSLVPGPAGVVSTAGDQWYESMAWPGLSSHVGGVRLATLGIAGRMARMEDDAAFAAQCDEWHEQGSRMMEDCLWAGSHYLIYNDEWNSQASSRHQTERQGAEFIASVNEGAGRKSDLVLSYQLDGEWMARFHGVPGVFPKDRVRRTLATIERLNAPLTTAGLLVVVGADGRPTSFGGRMGGLSSMPASGFITAMNYIYEGERETGLRIAHDTLNEMACVQGMTWDLPNIMIGTWERKQRVYGTDYYQCLSLWALPAALSGETIAAAAGSNGLIDRMLRAASRAATNPAALPW